MKPRASSTGLRLTALAASIVVTFTAGAVQPLPQRPFHVGLEAPVSARADAKQIQNELAQESARYIVVLKEAPLAMYDGGEPGLARAPRVAGRLDVRSEEAQDYVEHVRDEQDEFLASASQLLGREVAPFHPDFRFQHAINAIVVDLLPSEVAKLEQHPDVKFVEIERTYTVDTDNGPPLIGAGSIWDGSSTPGNLATRGEGVVVGIIDSGINIGSPSFADIGADGYDHTNPLGAGNYLGWCNPANPNHVAGRDVCNDKLIGGWDFADAAVGTSTTVSEARGFEDSNGHGSHTASTAAGNVRDPVTASFSGVPVTMSGVAPHANIIAYDVCHTVVSSGQGTCSGAALVGAINQVVADGIVDVINYSISGGTSPWFESTSLGFLAATNAGVVVVASAGNSGPGPATLGHLEPWTITTGATTHDRVFGFDFDLTGPGTPPANTQNIVVRPGGSPIATVTYTGTPIVSPGFADGATDGCTAYPPDTFRVGGVPTGAQGLAVLHLNTITSACGSGARRTAALNAGANATLFVTETPANLGAANETWQMLEGEWAPVAAQIATDPATASVTITAPVARLQGVPDTMASFSSRGPNFFDVLKPDVSAPGFEILATVNRFVSATPRPFGGAVDPMRNNIIALNSGTSMASPHAAGAAALLRALNRSWTPTQIKSALVTTARTSATFKEDGTTLTDPFDRGGGRVDLTRAARAGLVLNETTANFQAANPAIGGDVSTLNVPNMMQAACVGTCTFTRTVQSTRSGPVTWNASVAGFAPGVASVSPASFTIANSATQQITVSIDSTALAQGQFSFGELVLVPSVGTIPEAHMPVAVQPGIPDVEVTPASISANVEEGDSTTASLEVANVGNPTIDWQADTGTGTHPFVAIPEDGVWGNSSNFYSLQTPAPGGAYGADDFVPDDDMVLREIRAEGFNTGSPTLTLQARATQITFKVYADDNGVPAGRPESGAAGEVYSCVRNVAAGPGASGLSFLVADGSIFELDAVEAAADGCAAPPTLTEGTRYWVSVFPTVPGTSAQRRWAWSRGTVEIGLGAKLYSPAAIGGYPSAGWGDAGQINNPPNPIGLASFAFTVRGDVACGAPWLSVSPASDSLGLAESTDVTVSMDASTLAAGTYRGYVCVDTLGTDVDEPEPVVPVTLSVGAVPTDPVAAGLAAPASVAVTGSTLLTVEVTPGANPASTGVQVRADLTAIGGSSTQAFVNDGTGGDVSDTDNIWSYTANVPLATAPGNKSLTATVTDGQSRTATANIALEVQTPVDPVATGAASPATVSVTQSTVLTVDVTPGTNPSSTGIDVVADLSAIGGSATTTFLDDGQGADEALGDGIYTFEAIVALDTPPGAKSLAVGVADDQGRDAATSIDLTVATPTAMSGSGSASPSNVLAGGDVVLTYTVTPGANPPSSGVEVAVDLTNVGGGSAVAMLDDGVAPDAQQGDLVFTLAASVGAGTSTGVKVLPVAVSDDQNRGFSGAIALNVIEAGDPTAVGVAVPGSAGPGGTATLIVSVTPGTNPDSTGIGVTVDLTAIGGSAAQAFRDDGDGGDQTAGDNVFTYVATVDGDAQPGAKVLTATALDAQGRTAVASIDFTVQGGTTTLLIDGFEDP